MSNPAIKPLQAATLVILLVVGALYWYAGKQQDRYDAPATAYLRSALADIGGWQRSALQRHLDDEALRTLSATQLDAITERYRSLGAFQRIDELKFTRLTPALSLFSANTLLSYHGRAQFQNGSADVAATLVVRGEGFRFYNLSLSTPQLR